jgi:hypothetical protein
VLFGLLLAPVRGVVRLAELLEQEGLRRLQDPALVRRQLAEVDDAWARGEISDAERDAWQDELVARLVSQRASDG